MDERSYEIILRRRGFDVSTVEDRRGKGLGLGRMPHGARPHQEETAWGVCLREDLSKNKAVWYDHWLLDLWCFARNTNPVLALLFSHKKHPVSRKERTYITGLSFVFVMMTSLCCVECTDCIACHIMSCASNSDCVVSIDLPVNSHGEALNQERGWQKELGHDRTEPPAANYCCMCARSGASWIISRVHLDLRIITISGAMVYQLVANVLFGQLHFQLAACGCCQRRGNQTRKRWYMVAWGAMACTLPALLVPSPLFVAYAAYNGLVESTLSTFLLMQLQTKLATTGFQTLVFSILWQRQRRNRSEGFHVTAAEYRLLASVSALPCLDAGLGPGDGEGGAAVATAYSARVARGVYTAPSALHRALHVLVSTLGV